MKDFAKTGRTKLRRKHGRGRYDRETVYAILDEALVAHVAIVEDGRPVVIPTCHWRDGDRLYLHGSRASRLLEHLASGGEACVAVTILDGLVLARSGFHSSVNYRSVVIFGAAEPVEGADEKRAALRAFMERIAPGRWDELRPPTQAELRASRVVAIPLTEASAKVRTGPPVDNVADYADAVWAGVVPLSLAAGRPVPDRRVKKGVKRPRYLSAAALARAGFRSRP